ncbi:MAG: M28 family peptidase [Cytophagales bacterium]|nr:MAG: M28 family peptidase [Cytophagales bacterium]
MKFLNIPFFICVFAVISLNSCGGKKTKQKTDVEQDNITTPIVLQKAPIFESDSAYRFIEKQLSFGKRVPNTEGHRRCGDYLVSQLKAYQWEVIEQKFEAVAYDSTILQSRNIIASYNPKATRRILLAAHWDTRHVADKEKDAKKAEEAIEGANDGASGVAVLLEIARLIGLGEMKPTVGVDIIFFDSEDYGKPNGYKKKSVVDNDWCLGSQYWSKNKHKADYQAYYGILLDMVGAKGAIFYREGTSMQYAGIVNQRFWTIANQLGYKQFVNQDSPSIVDDHYYVNTIAKIPMMNIIEFDVKNPASFFAPYHHTHQDNLSIIDKTTLKAVGQSVVQMLYNEVAQ